MNSCRRLSTTLVVAAVLVTTAACGGGSNDADATAGDTSSTMSSTMSSTTTAFSTTTTLPADARLLEGGLGILTLRPVISCESRARADDALGEDLLSFVDDDRSCVVGPSSGTGAVFERGSAEAQPDEQTDQWVVNVDLRRDGQAVWDAAAMPCYTREATCPSGQLAIVLDEVIQSAPIVQTPDFPSAIQISGGFSMREARELADILNRVVEPVGDPDDTVPPTLPSTTTRPPSATAVDTTVAPPVEEAPVVDWDGEYRPKTTPGQVVQLGDVGVQVEMLQQALSRLGYPIDVDGYFGYGTESAVRQFQRDRGLPVTGIATDDVWDSLGE